MNEMENGGWVMEDGGCGTLHPTPYTLHPKPMND